MPDTAPPEDDDPLERTVALEDLNHAMALALLAMGLDDPAADGHKQAVEQFRRDLLALGVTSVELDEAGIKATDPARTSAALADELAERRRDATFGHRLVERVRDDGALLGRIAGTDPAPADLPGKIAAVIDRTATEPPEGQLIRFRTKAQGAVVGPRFGDYYCSATSTESWSAHFVTGWEPLLVVPDTQAVAELVASVIGQHMVIRKGPPEIAAAVLAALREVP